jgi:enamine deaminase RidA (YjgF/YER057c/UK114 family)
VRLDSFREGANVGLAGDAGVRLASNGPLAPHRHRAAARGAVLLCTLQLHAVRSARQSGVWYGNSAKPAAATVLRGGARHLRLMSITPRTDLRGSADVVDMTYDMLAQAGHALTDRGLGFKDVVRTWIYVRDIEHNYGFVNQARNRFFEEQHLVRLPASTCVEGVLSGAAAPVAMDLYAVAAKADVGVQAIAPGPMGEASAYGSAFARGSQIVEPGRKTLYISGTASIDAQRRRGRGGGHSWAARLHVRQPARAACQGRGWTWATWSAPRPTSSARSIFAIFSRRRPPMVCPSKRPPRSWWPTICRPEWLCEIEVCAVQTTPEP